MKQNSVLVYFTVSIFIFSLVLSSTFNNSLNSIRQIIDEREPISISYYTHDPFEIDSDDDFVALGFAGSGLELDPYLIDSLSITTTTSNPCIEISDTTVHFVIRHCAFETEQNTDLVVIDSVADNTTQLINNTFGETIDSKHGLLISDSDGVYIADNFFSTVSGDGISMYFSDNTIIEHNNFHTADRGVRIYKCLFATIIDNYFYQAYVAISSIYSCYLHFVNNTIMYSIGAGITLTATDYCFIAGNHIENTTTSTGMSLSDSDNNLIWYNWIEYCYSYGVVLDETTKKNVVHHNLFFDNSIGYPSNPQGRDRGTQNEWYDSDNLQGNYWSDATGGAYDLSGEADNSDPYPLPGIPMLLWKNMDIPEIPSDDIYEKNDYIEGTTHLETNAEYSLALLDEDYFDLTLKKYQTLNVTINYSLTEQDLFLGLYRLAPSGYIEIFNFVNPGDGFSFEYECTFTNEYYLNIEPEYYNIPFTTYDLNITARYSFDRDDEYEENDDFMDAADYDELERVQDLVYTDKDYYTIPLEKSSSITVNITYMSEDVDLDLFLLPHNYDTVDDILIQSITGDQTEEFNFVVDRSKDYIILVSSKDLNGIPIQPIGYVMTVEITIPTQNTNSISIILSIISLLSLAFVWKKFKK